MRRKPISIPTFTLGWEFESITDVYGSQSNNDGDDGYPCDNCGDIENPGDCDDHNGSYGDNDGASHDCPVREVNVIEDGSVNGASLEYVLRKEFIHSPDMGIHALWKLLTKTEVETDKSCGFHVHIGLPERSSKALMWAGWVQQLGVMLEEKVFLAVPESRRNNQYCRKLQDYKQVLSEKRFNEMKYSNSERYYWINTVEMFRPTGIRTVEFRLMGNVRRYSYLIAWIAFCRQMAKSAWKLTHDVSYLSHELQILEYLVARLIDTFLPRKHEGNRLMIAYDILKGTGLNMRPEMTFPLAELVHVEDRIDAECYYGSSVNEIVENTNPFKVGDIIRRVTGTMRAGEVYIIQEIVSEYNVRLLGLEGQWTARNCELVDIDGLCVDEAFRNNGNMTVGVR